MNAQQAISRFVHRPVRVSVKFPNASRQIVGFIEDEEDFDSFESELKRMIEMSGMVTPQYEPVVTKSRDRILLAMTEILFFRESKVIFDPHTLLCGMSFFLNYLLKGNGMNTSTRLIHSAFASLIGSALPRLQIKPWPPTSSIRKSTPASLKPTKTTAVRA